MAKRRIAAAAATCSAEKTSERPSGAFWALLESNESDDESRVKRRGVGAERDQPSSGACSSNQPATGSVQKPAGPREDADENPSKRHKSNAASSTAEDAEIRIGYYDAQYRLHIHAMEEWITQCADDVCNAVKDAELNVVLSLIHI